MKMTRQEVIELLQNMNDDCSNVELLHYDNKWYSSYLNDVKKLLENIAGGLIYRIKDNSVKEMTMDLFDRVVIRKDGKGKGKITYVELGNENNSAYVTIGSLGYNLTNFNKYFQLVEANNG